MNDVLENVEKRVSNWCKLKMIIAPVLIYQRRLLLKGYRKKGMVEMTASYDIVPDTQSFPDLKSVQMAESVLIKSSQRRYFSNELKIGCPLNSNQKNDKKMTNFLVKNEKKMKKMSKKIPKKHYESQLGNKLLSKHNKYRTLAYFTTNNLHLL